MQSTATHLDNEQATEHNRPMPEFSPLRNPTGEQITALVARSRHDAARRIIDPTTGDAWYWPAEQATHAEGAAKLGIPYDRPPGAGDIVTRD